MIARSRIFVALAILVSAAGALHPLWAQNHALVVFAHGGRHSPLVNLTDAGDDLSPAFSYGGGIALQFGPSTALRASLTYHRARYRGATATPADSGLARFSYGADLQIGWPSTSAFVPYIYLGGGAISTDFDAATEPTTTGVSGRFGIGLNRVAGLGAVFAEVGTMIYRFKGLGLERIQFDLEGHLGFALALGF